jgi:hypothetical protein
VCVNLQLRESEKEEDDDEKEEEEEDKWCVREECIKHQNT